MFDRRHEAHHQGGIGACMHGQVMMDGKKKHFCELVNLQIVVVFFANTYNAPMASAKTSPSVSVFLLRTTKR